MPYVDLTKADLSQVTTFSSMFMMCRSLKEARFGASDTSKVGSMESMFCYCTAMQRVDLSGLDTSGVQNMSQMFFGCKSLREIIVGDHWQVPACRTTLNPRA